MAADDESQSDADVSLEAPKTAGAAAGVSKTSAPPKILLGQTVQETIRQHANSDLTHEVGGVLVGQVIQADDEVFVNVETALPAQDADTSAVHITFTHEAWEHWHKELDENYAGKIIVGWYHSHPSYGIFLSADDTFIQRNFFNLPWQIAIVVDPVRKEQGTFIWEDGKITRRDEAAFLALERKPERTGVITPDDEVEPPVLSVEMPKEGARSSRLGWLGWVVAAAFFVFAVFQTSGEMKTTARVKTLETNVAALASAVKQSADAEQQMVINLRGAYYTWQTGDTWQSVASRLLGRPDLARALAMLNGRSGQTPSPGTNVWVPSKQALEPLVGPARLSSKPQNYPPPPTAPGP